MSFIAKQPNGLYCRFSSVVDTVTNYNMTREEYIEKCMEQAKREAIDTLDNPQPFEEVEKRFVPNNMTRKRFKEIIKEMNTKV